MKKSLTLVFATLATAALLAAQGFDLLLLLCHGRLELDDCAPLLSDVLVLFEKLIKQHRVHRFLAHTYHVAVFTAQDILNTAELMRVTMRPVTKTSPKSGRNSPRKRGSTWGAGRKGSGPGIDNDLWIHLYLRDNLNMFSPRRRLEFGPSLAGTASIDVNYLSLILST